MAHLPDIWVEQKIKMPAYSSIPRRQTLSPAKNRAERLFRNGLQTPGGGGQQRHSRASVFFGQHRADILLQQWGKREQAERYQQDSQVLIINIAYLNNGPQVLPDQGDLGLWILHS